MAVVIMSKIDRLFELVQELRRARKPVTGRELSDKLGVSVRTVYRDCASLQAMGIPIEGEAGVGYVMRRGYDLPPLAFTEAEQEAMIVGLRMLGRTGDAALLDAADKVISKLAIAASISEVVTDVKRFVSQAGAPQVSLETMNTIRKAIDGEHKLSIVYRDRHERESCRVICPLCLIYYPDASVIAAWCELRSSFRHFRIDWLISVAVLDCRFEGLGRSLRDEWRNLENWPLSYLGAVARC